MTDIKELIEKRKKELEARWSEIKEKLGISSEFIVIDIIFRENDLGQRSLTLLGTDSQTVWNPTSQFVDELVEALPASVSISGADYNIEPIDFEALTALISKEKPPFEFVSGEATLTSTGKLYLDVGGRRYWFTDTVNAQKLKRILQRNRLKKLEVKLITLTLEAEEGGQIFAFCGNWEAIKQDAKKKREEIESLLQPDNMISAPDKPLRWKNLTEEQRNAFVRHYLKLAMVREGSPLILTDESLPHHLLAYVIFKPEGSRKFTLMFNRELIQDFLELLGFNDPERPILAQDLEREILTNFPDFKKVLRELQLEAIREFLAPGHREFDEKRGTFVEVGKMRIPECVEKLLKDVPHLENEHLMLLASYIKFYSKGLPVPADESLLRKGEKPDKRLALWGWIVRRLGYNNFKLVTTFREYYKEAKPPFMCPGRKRVCPYVDEKGTLPKCPFVAWMGKVERYIALIDHVEIHAPDAIVIHFGDNSLVLDGLDIESSKLIEQFRSWLIATFGENFTKSQAGKILIGLMDRAHLVKSEYGEAIDVIDQLNQYLAELAKRGICPWEHRNATVLFFDETKTVVHVTNTLLMPFLASIGYKTIKGIKKQLMQNLGKYIVKLNHRLSPLPMGPNSQTMIRPHAILLRRQYFEEVLGIEVTEKTFDDVEEELPPEEGEV